MGKNGRTIVVLTALAALVASGCAPTNQPFDSDTPITLMTRIARQAQQCWFKSGDKDFSSFKMAIELNSHVGRPRILLVPRKNPGGLPKLVIQAERKSGAVKLSSFGPLLGGPLAPKISRNINSWAARSSQC